MTTKTVHECLVDPPYLNEWDRDKCPNKGPICRLVSDGKTGSFACRNCGTGYLIAKDGLWYSFDWHGKWPWE